MDIEKRIALLKTGVTVFDVIFKVALILALASGGALPILWGLGF